MTQLPDPSRSSRYAPLVWFSVVYLATTTATRVALGLRSPELDAAQWVRSMAVGLGFDTITLLYVGMPFVLWLGLTPSAWLRRGWYRCTTAFAAVASLFGAMLVALSEWLFWAEFDTRFNFIAIDYLIYTREVLGNVLESYQVKTLVLGVAATALVATLFTWKPIIARAPSMPRWRLLGGWLAAAAVATAAVDHSMSGAGDDKYVSELSGNGVYQLFAAFRHNEIDYFRFYPTLPEAVALRGLREELRTADATFVSDDPHDITRDIVNPGPERRLNVVLVSMESMSAEFLGVFGNSAGLTPNLDRLAAEGLLFKRTYATGTRTVRGLEALSIAVPPTPGQSIVRRPHNDNLFSLASVFAERGYDRKFVYGGYAYFDNMGPYFGANGYSVVDRRAIPAASIHHETVWGVSDEDLYTQAIAEMNTSHAAGRPFFLHIMTTSNHRPFTYPEGRIDIASGTGRDGAVKYADWAIGKFVADARKTPWFKDTLFVFVADHQAASAGKTGLPVERYLIPLIVYSPGNVAVATVDRLMSQIDVPPTVLGLLNFSYRSRFLGWDIFKADPVRDRAFVSTYQELGFVDGGRLVSLKPRARPRVGAASVPASAGEDDTDAELVDEAISWYQATAVLFRRGALTALH